MSVENRNCAVCGRGIRSEFIWCSTCQASWPELWDAIQNPPPDPHTPEEQVRRDHAVEVMLTSDTARRAAMLKERGGIGR